jgi:hypothetical protein
MKKLALFLKFLHDYLPVYILGLIIHGWTTIIAFLKSGILVAILTFATPGLSEVYWLIKIGVMEGFGNIYPVLCMAYICIVYLSVFI